MNDGEQFASVPELDMFGERSTSPNGRYTLVWHDEMGLDGRRVSGRYVLLDADAVLVDRSMQRPNDGKVADNGTFILNDWGGEELSGTFTAFRRDGSSILSRSFSANLYNSGLSADGTLAVCQTCHSPGSPDNSVLTVFDLEAAAEMARWTAESGWADGYEFPEGGGRIRMVRRERPSLDYSVAGEFIDRPLWLRDEVARGTLYVIRKVLAEGEATTSIPIDALRLGARKAIAEGDERVRADAWRLLGEIEERAGNDAAALAAYDEALRHNPKIGVARRVAALRKSAPQM